MAAAVAQLPYVTVSCPNSVTKSKCFRFPRQFNTTVEFTTAAALSSPSKLHPRRREPPFVITCFAANKPSPSSEIRRIPKISKTDKLLMCWWVFTGLTHMVLEGYFVFTPEFYKQKNPTFIAEVWKEYSKGDSRYVGRDSAVVSVEAMTAVLEGPASILVAYAIATRKSYSHILQVAIALGQLYGCGVYFITSYLDGDNFAVDSFYYYTYYIFANSFWVWIPTLIVIRSWKKICEAVAALDQKKKTKTR